MKKLNRSSVIEIKISCPNLNKDVMIPTSSVHFSGSESECEMCGSHGNVILSVYECECGKSHEIELESW